MPTGVKAAAAGAVATSAALTAWQVDSSSIAIQAAFGISDIPELHDRLVAATARHYGVPLLTNDPVIRASTAGPTIWE